MTYTRSMPTGGGSSTPTTAPRYAVAEASVHPARRARYASADSLGNAFNFDMQDAEWRADDYRRVINNGLADMINNGSTTSWLLGCHDIARVATRYGLPPDKDRPAHQVARAWLMTDGTTPRLDRELGERRARAAIMILLALPGSTYIYQGDELGLHEVAELPREVLEDPMASRSTTDKGRDGCRVPLPWSLAGPSYGFGARTAHLPQPDWFGAYAVSVQEADPSLDAQSLPTRGRTSWPPVRWQRPPLGRFRAVSAALEPRRRTVRDQLRRRPRLAAGGRGDPE